MKLGNQLPASYIIRRPTILLIVDEKGGFFPYWKKDKERFMYPCSEEVKRWLRRLKQGNKKVFLMSSSRIDFAEASMEFVLGLVWLFHQASIFCNFYGFIHYVKAFYLSNYQDRLKHY